MVVVVVATCCGWCASGKTVNWLMESACPLVLGFCVATYCYRPAPARPIQSAPNGIVLSIGPNMSPGVTLSTGDSPECLSDSLLRSGFGVYVGIRVDRPSRATGAGPRDAGPVDSVRSIWLLCAA